jgi:hypothetical protein
MKESLSLFLVALISWDLGTSPSIKWIGNRGICGSASLHSELIFLTSITSMPFLEITIRSALLGKEELIELLI